MNTYRFTMMLIGSGVPITEDVFSVVASSAQTAFSLVNQYARYQYELYDANAHLLLDLLVLDRFGQPVMLD